MHAVIVTIMLIVKSTVVFVIIITMATEELVEVSILISKIYQSIISLYFLLTRQMLVFDI